MRSVFAWTGAALFVGSLTYFVFSYYFTYGRATAVATPGAAAWDVGLFTIFALHHSVFARPPIRRRVSRLVTPANERAFYVWAASLLFIAVCALWRPVAGVLWDVEGAWRTPFWVAQGLGAWLTLASAATIGVLVLAGVREAPHTGFTVAGPYGWVRHPIYSGWFLLVFALPTMTMTRLVFAAISCAYLIVAIPFEERSLLASSHGAYAAYARQVRWKIIPGIY
jgi:methanethiol S-methyltransferase